MVESLLLRWVLTFLFVLTAVWCGFRVAGRAGGWRDRLSWTGHIAMCLLMIAMVWPWGMSVPAGPQIGLFAVATAWYAVLIALRVPCGHLRKSARLAHGHHAVMSAAMVWMVATMPALMPGTHGSGTGGHHHALGAPASGVIAMAAPESGPVGGVVLVSALLAGFLVLSSMAWISSAVDSGRTGASRTDAQHALDAACHGAMSVGMGVMLFSVL